MALVKYGGGIIQMSGSIAGNTLARNRYGNYMRARTKPINPKSERQMSARGVIQYLTEYWHETLDATQRGAWANYAAAVAMKNKLGETIKLSGFNHFIRSNTSRLSANLAIVPDGPTTPALPAIDPGFLFTTSAYYQKLVIQYTPDAPWSKENGAALIVHAGRPQLETRNFFGGPWRAAGKLEGNDVTPPEQQTMLEPQFTLTAGQRIWCFHLIAMADGRLSSPSRYGPVTIIESGP